MAAKKPMLAQPVPFAPSLPEAEASMPTIEVQDSLEQSASATANWSTYAVANAQSEGGEIAADGADQEPAEAEATGQDGEMVSAGTEPQEEGQRKNHDLPDTMMQPDSQLVLAGEAGKSGESMIESMPEENDDMEVICKKCGRSVSILQTMARSDTSRWCLSCNALQTLLRRHMSWPPEQFSKMSDDDQKKFFLMANMQKDTDQFKYSRVRDLLTKSMVKSKISETAMSVGGTYKPLSVLIKKGYLLPDDFEQTSPRLGSEALKCYTYLLPELSIQNTEISRSVEEQILKAERAIKKRKLDDSKKDDKNQEDGDFVVDLLSDDEDKDYAQSEGQMGIMWVDAATAPRAEKAVHAFILLNTTFTGHSCSFSLTHVCWQAIQKQRKEDLRKKRRLPSRRSRRLFEKRGRRNKRRRRGRRMQIER